MSDDFEKMFGPVIGRGAQATVYAKGSYAVKLYRAGYPKANVFTEAYIMANLDRVDFPSPKVYEVLLTDGRYGLRMDRVAGKMMSEEFCDPAGCAKALAVLVDLQLRLQAYDLSWARDLKERFRDDLVCNNQLLSGVREKLLDILDGLPSGLALCHCDFHSGNVFSDNGKYTIIDLLQISRGDPAADAACSYVAYLFTNRELAEYYLQLYSTQSGISEAQIRQWLPVYAGTLLGQIPESYTETLKNLIDLTME